MFVRRIAGFELAHETDQNPFRVAALPTILESERQ